MLSGGLDPDNLAAAATISGASVLDVSSGVEAAPGVKDPAKIRLFLARAKAL
jgi:phosphoribosylanthranilate isomerase